MKGKIVICKLVRDLVFSENPFTGDNEAVVARNCLFKEDFGPWKTGQRVEVLLHLVEIARAVVPERGRS